MYLNTLIFLEENVSGYGKNNKSPKGHITIAMPGVVKCYVQDLCKGEKDYVVYLISKSANKAIRMGKMNNPVANKQTTWKIDVNNVDGSGIQGKDIDCVAVVVEGDTIGKTDTVMLGYAKDKYLTTSMIEHALPKVSKPMPKPETKPMPKPETKPMPKPETKPMPEPTPYPIGGGIGPVIIPEECGCAEQYIPTEDVQEKTNKKVLDKTLETQLEEQIKKIINQDNKKEIGQCLEREIMRQVTQVLQQDDVSEKMEQEYKDLNTQINVIMNNGMRDLDRVEEADIEDETQEDGLVKVDSGEDNTEDTAFPVVEEETPLTQEEARQQEYLSQVEQALHAFQESMEKGIEEKKKENTLGSALENKEVLLRVADIYYNSDPIYPFNEEEGDVKWVRIDETELSSIPELPYEWCEEPFITYCYYKFGHLILGKEKTLDQYYVGIPDLFDPKRSYILDMERIERFKTRDGENPRAGVFGYWIAML